jgi:hypothetical protein
MDVRLLVANTSSASKQIRLGAMTLIGRSPDCNLRIASGQVSRRHCLIKVDETAVSVRDLGSANGTRLNGEPVSTQTEVTVPPGSTLIVGPLKFIVQFAAPKSRDDEDTEWLPRLPSAEAGRSEPGGENEIQSLIPPPSGDGEETKDLPLSRRRKQGIPPQVVVSDAGSVDEESGESGSDSIHGVDPGKRTEPDLAALANETVFDMSAEGLSDAPASAAALRQKASETHLVFEEDDLKQLNVEGVSQAAPLADDSDSSSSEDGLDDDLRKFLNDS